MSRFPRASVGDILRSAQKDEEVRGDLRENVSELVALVAPGRFRPWIPSRALADGLFWMSTSLLGVATPGEEYCDLEQVSWRGKEHGLAVSAFSRMILVITVLVGKQGVLVGLRWLLRKTLRRYGWQPGRESNVVEFLERAHLGLFYWAERYYEWSKRLAGITYVRTTYRGRGMVSPRYGILAMLLVVQLSVSLLTELVTVGRRMTKTSLLRVVLHGLGVEDPLDDLSSGSQHHESEDESDPSMALVRSEKRCALCLSRMCHPTATECGHVFCWACVTSWCASNDVCPMCRQRIQMKGLLCIYGY